ncbi:hypothetical protein [Antarctobacter sp.]|uniref:hypothetical protein n=1 Tax=Antarctobacter sp. TaxID=1872577 RepID=UPI002B274585|nr:hypothetical protein [Antarctobacter sp.]
MSTSPNTEILLGCDPQVRVVIIEDEGNLVVQVFAEDPANTDIDALFFNLSNDSVAGELTIWPGYDESIGSNGENVTGYDVSIGTLSALSTGAQIQEGYDVRLEFGQIPYTAGGDVDSAQLTFYVDGGDYQLTADDIDLTNMTAVINSEGGGGIALTGGLNVTASQTEVVALSESFDGGFGDGVAGSDNWYVNSTGHAMTDGNNDGALTFDTVATDGPVSISLDARGVNIDRFENGGYYGDSLTLQVQIDGGDWVTLDTFEVNDSGTALVGDTTGQQIGDSFGTLTYSGGLLDTATQDVQFRIVSDISADDEKVSFDNVEITVTESDAPVEVIQTETVALTEGFDHGFGDGVESSGRWYVNYHDQATTNGYHDGALTFDTVETEGPVGITLDARGINIDRFENSGYSADSLTLQVQIDGGDWVTLDTFAVNDQGTALVGDTTGQTIGSGWGDLSYSGGVLDTASEDVQFRIVSDISACDEIIKIDNVEITVTETVVADHSDEACEDFEAAEAGDTAALQFDGFSVTAQREGDDPDSGNDAMIFDTANPTGGDWDLHFADQGNAIIISEDGDAGDPDDNAQGGTIMFEFDEVSDVTSLTLLDVEEEGGAIDLYDTDGELINSIAIPAGGNNSAQDIAINTSGVATMTVTLAGSGAVDDLCYSVPGEDPDDCGQYDVTYDDWMVADPLPEDPLVEDVQPDDAADVMII